METLIKNSDKIVKYVFKYVLFYFYSSISFILLIGMLFVPETKETDYTNKFILLFNSYF